MAKFLDSQCNIEFPSDAAYLVHKKAGHKGNLQGTTQIEAPPVPTPPPGVPADAMPSPELMEQIQRIEGKKEEKPSVGDSMPSQHPTELPPADPVVLTYKYLGVCPEHRVPVDTLELDVAEKHFCVAVCPTCKKQLDTKEVANLLGEVKL